MTWIEDVQAMRPGDPCEFRYPARNEWLPGTVEVNGASGYWTVRSDSEAGKRVRSIYAEHVRAPGGDDAFS